MTRQEAIDYMTERGYAHDPEKRIIFRVIDHTNNPFAPEKTAYRIAFTCRGVRVKFGIWPNTVGYQGY